MPAHIFCMPAPAFCMSAPAFNMQQLQHALLAAHCRQLHTSPPHASSVCQHLHAGLVRAAVALRRAETHFFFIYFLAGSESRYFTQINNFRYLRKSLKSLQRAHFLTFGCDTKYTTFSKTPEKNNSEFPTILKRLFLISIKELREKSLDDPPKYWVYLGGS